MKELAETRTPSGTRRSGVTLENRERIILTGITETDSFNETEVTAHTDLCGVTVFGQNLHITKLDLESGTLVISGFICGFEYTDIKEKSGGFFTRLLK